MDDFKMPFIKSDEDVPKDKNVTFDKEDFVKAYMVLTMFQICVMASIYFAQQ